MVKKLALVSGMERTFMNVITNEPQSYDSQAFVKHVRITRFFRWHAGYICSELTIGATAALFFKLFSFY